MPRPPWRLGRPGPRRRTPTSKLAKRTYRSVRRAAGLAVETRGSNVWSLGSKRAIPAGQRLSQTPHCLPAGCSRKGTPDHPETPLAGAWAAGSLVGSPLSLEGRCLRGPWCRGICSPCGPNATRQTPLRVCADARDGFGQSSSPRTSPAPCSPAHWSTPMASSFWRRTGCRIPLRTRTTLVKRPGPPWRAATTGPARMCESLSTSDARARSTNGGITLRAAQPSHFCTLDRSGGGPPSGEARGLLTGRTGTAPSIAPRSTAP